jgi:hypothetical protein
MGQSPACSIHADRVRRLPTLLGILARARASSGKALRQ